MMKDDERWELLPINVSRLVCKEAKLNYTQLWSIVKDDERSWKMMKDGNGFQSMFQDLCVKKQSWITTNYEVSRKMMKVGNGFQSMSQDLCDKKPSGWITPNYEVL